MQGWVSDWGTEVGRGAPRICSLASPRPQPPAEGPAVVGILPEAADPGILREFVVDRPPPPTSRRGRTTSWARARGERGRGQNLIGGGGGEKAFPTPSRVTFR